jgi:hypothetical protein
VLDLSVSDVADSDTCDAYFVEPSGTSRFKKSAQQAHRQTLCQKWLTVAKVEQAFVCLNS